MKALDFNLAYNDVYKQAATFRDCHGYTTSAIITSDIQTSITGRLFVRLTHTVQAAVNLEDITSITTTDLLWEG